MKKSIFLSRTLLVLMLIMGSFTSASAISKATSSQKVETLQYDAYWHWGPIWKKAGSGILTLWDEQNNDGVHRFHGQLAGRSLSIVESIMKVRDTLDCWYTPNMVPMEYCKKTNEGSYKAIERNYYQSFTNGKSWTQENVDSTKVSIYRWRNKNGNDQKNFSHDGVAFDMLSVFYEIRNLDYDSMAEGTRLQYRIYSGIKGQFMNVEYRGKTTCTLRSGKQYPAYRIELTFQSKDSDSTPLQVWLATTPDHRPLSVIIQLKRIGAVQGEIVE